MKKNIGYIIIGIIVIALVTLIFFSIKRENNKRIHTFPETVVVENSTKFEVDTLIKILTNKVFKIDTMNFIVTYMPIESVSTDKIIYQAYILKNNFKKNHYIIYISKSVNKSRLKALLAHELIHLQQYESGDLIQLNDSIITFRGDTLNIKEIEYSDRPQEIDAFSREYRTIRELNKLIYK